MIVRNESAHIGECLQSLQGLVDDVVVVDTGSEDRTKDIAASYDARIFEFPWDDDFSAARNFAIDQARGRWILYIDADERLRPYDRSNLEVLLGDPGKVAYRVRFHVKSTLTAFYEYRIFRNDPRIRFSGLMHEKITPGIDRMAAEDGLEIAKCDITLVHLGYDGDQTKKHHRNLPLLRKQLARDPSDVYNWRHLGVVLWELGDMEAAEDALLHAVDLARARGKNDDFASLAFQELLRFLQHRDIECVDLMTEAVERFPDCPTILWLQALAFKDRGKFEQALPFLHRLAAIDGENFTDELTAYDKRIFDLFSYETLGYCYFHLGNFTQSARWYGCASDVEPDRQDIRTRLALARAKAEDSNPGVIH